MIRQRVLGGLAVFAVAVPALHFGRGLDWPFAFLAGVALGAFGFLLVRAIHNLQAWRPRR